VGGLSPRVAVPTVKYHYFDRFFTHSVMRNTSSPDCVGSLLGERSARRVGLVLTFASGTGEGATPISNSLRGKLASSRPPYGRARSVSRKPPDGEFDWGGTSVKR
jgi:hypothetical protein